MKKLQKMYEEFFIEFCKVRGLDPSNEHLKETPQRVVNALLELTEGYNSNINLKCFKDSLDCNESINNTFSRTNGVLIIHNTIPFISTCAHHLIPFYGYAYIGLLLTNSIVGLSKVSRVVEMFAKRLQLQEQLTFQITDYLTTNIDGCRGVITITDAMHGCMFTRGVRKNSVTTCSSLTGIFKTNDENIKQEFLDLISPHRKKFDITT